jgi:outer membrane lipoprotein-sorting protein
MINQPTNPSKHQGDKTKTKITLLTLTLITAMAMAESTITVDEIVDRANRTAYYQGRDGRAKVSMAITDSQGRQRTREFTILRLDLEPADQAAAAAFSGDQKMYVYFERPADVNKMAYLVHKHTDGRDDDRWLYMPGLSLVKRIAASDKRTSFVGSDFFYEDVSGRNPADDTHELVETTDTYYVLNNIPKDPKSVEFASYKVWIHKATFLPIKGEYYDAAGSKFREMQALEVKEIQGFQTVTKSQMHDLRSGSTTTISYNRVEYDIGLNEDIFTERYLRAPPRAQLR